MATLLLTNFLQAIPYLVLWSIGLILAVVWRKRLTKAAFLLALLGCILHLLHTLTFESFGGTLPVLLMQGKSSMAQVTLFTVAASFLSRMTTLIASALLIAAIFTGRKGTTSAQD